MTIVAEPTIPAGTAPQRPLADVLAAAARGEPTAWRDLVERYSPRIFALARSRCRNLDTAEEVTQSVFVTVAAKLSGNGAQNGSAHGYVEMGRFEPWLFRIAMNRIRDEVRRRGRQAPGADAADLAVLVDRRGPDARAGELAGLRAALDRLPDADREVIDLRHHGGLSFRQIADLVGEPIGTLLARHHRALRKLRAMMSGNEEDDR
jgi:RNA polymerase sigma-70 factor, ECF subfamily